MANTYRIQKTAPQRGNADPGRVGEFWPQFSQDAGSTWYYASKSPYKSLTSAKDKLANVVLNEATFNAKVSASRLVPVTTYISYP